MLINPFLPKSASSFWDITDYSTSREFSTLQHCSKQELELCHQLLEVYDYKGRLDTLNNIKDLEDDEQVQLFDEAYMEFEKELESRMSIRAVYNSRLRDKKNPQPPLGIAPR